MTSKGVVFDIQRFSLHDGPGIRTTVFLKGCPLRCIWCHNPESWRTEPQLMFNRDKCNNCTRCADSCPNGVHMMRNGLHEADLSKCGACGRCAKQCVRGALKLSGAERTAADALAEVCADTVYYDHSGGGLTVSGGEPMLQFDFLRQLLRGAKARGLNVCLETCGYAEWEKFEDIRGFVDLFLYDIKHTDDAEHRRYTGVSNRVILSNLDGLCRAGSRVILRCPIIPGINDSDGHISGVARLARAYPGLEGVELLPYHDMGKDKWARLGKPYALHTMPSASEAYNAALVERFNAAGCQNARIG